MLCSFLYLMVTVTQLCLRLYKRMYMNIGYRKNKFYKYPWDIYMTYFSIFSFKKKSKKDKEKVFTDIWIVLVARSRKKV